MNKVVSILLSFLCALACTIMKGEETRGVHLTTSTSYDYTRRQGLISVESFVEGQVDVVRTAVPLDVMLVLDLSASMSQHIDGEAFIKYADFDASKPRSVYYDSGHWVNFQYGGYVSKMGRMMDAAYEFVCAISENARKMNLDHRVGIVTFSYGSLTSTAMALTSVNGHEAEFKDMIYSFRCFGATASSEGLKCARDAFSAIPSSRGKDARAVLLFTDGEPTNAIRFQASVADSSIVISHDLKKLYACSVYTVGAFDNDVDSRVNAYMNGVSSNYPDAMSLSDLGARAADSNYFLTVSSASSLSSIFDRISQEIIVGGASVSLEEHTQVREYLSSYVELPAGITPSDIKTYSVRCTSCDATSGTFVFSPEREEINLLPGGITIGEDEHGCDVLSVSGFNYKDNWCGPGMTNGHKLVIEIPFVLKADTSQGASAPVNQSASGMYDSSGNSVLSMPLASMHFNNVIIVREGLEDGESAVYRLVDAGSDAILCRVALCGVHGQTEQKCVIADVPDGSYKVIEEAWNWAYNTLPSKIQTISLPASGAGSVAGAGASTVTVRFSGSHISDAPLHDECCRRR